MTDSEIDRIVRLIGQPTQVVAMTSAGGNVGQPPIIPSPPTSVQKELEGISKESFWALMAASVTVFIACFALLLYFFKEELAVSAGIPLIIAWVLFWLVMAWIVSGFQRVGPTEVAVKEIFWGTWFQIVETGLTLAVPGVMRLHRFLQEIFTIKIGGPEKDGVTGFSFDTKNGVILCDNPLQVFFPNMQEADSNKAKVKGEMVGLTNRIPAWILVTITAKIDPAHVISLLRTGGNLPRVARRIEETTRGIIAQYCNRTEIHTALDSLETMAEEILGAIEELVGDPNPTRIKELTAEGKWEGKWITPPRGYEPQRSCWGIDIIRVQVETPILTAEMQNKIDEAQQAEQKATAKAREAKGEEADLKAKGRGNADAKRELLKAEADGRKAFMLAEADGMETQIKACDSDMGRFVRMLERDETIAEHAKPMIITEGGTGALDATLARTAKIWEFAQAKPAEKTTEPAKKPETAKKGA